MATASGQPDPSPSWAAWALDIAGQPFAWLEHGVFWLVTEPVKPLWRWLDRKSFAFENTRTRKIIAAALFPALIAAAMIIGLALVKDGLTIYALPITMGVFFGLGLIIAPLERLMPWSRKWLQSADKDSGVDVMVIVSMMGTSALIAGPATIFLTAWLVGWIHTQLPPDAIASFWPTTIHPALQVCLLLVIMDFFRYWYHRWMHENAFMWRWHSVHHSARRLYWFNSTRVHPLETFVSGLIWVVPFTLIQAPAEIVFVTGLVSRVIGRFQHTNMDVTLGPLEYVFSAPTNHRYHHSKLIAQGNANYGGDIVLWDHLFGTFHLPRGGRPSDDIGIVGIPDYPQSWLGLMLAPFRIRLWRRGDRGDGSAGS